MTRTEFVKKYAAGMAVPDKFAAAGFLEVYGAVRIALPCSCGDNGCEGWALVGAENIDSHLRFSAPEPLRSAYAAACEQLEQPQ